MWIEDLGALDDYERMLCYTPFAVQTKCFVELEGGHQVINGQALCCNPAMPDYGSSLKADVTCKWCREYWHFRVSPEYWRKQKGYLQSPLTKIRERSWCDCSSCYTVERLWASGKLQIS